jgi:hypothetical protein
VLQLLVLSSLDLEFFFFLLALDLHLGCAGVLHLFGHIEEALVDLVEA